MDQAKLQSWWAFRQGLDGSLDNQSPAAILERSGWARSVGGDNPYLSIWSRGGHSREAIDAAVAQCDIHELPSARGCTYVVPASDFALALRCGAGLSSDAEMKIARKLGVTDAEIDKLCDAICKALQKGPLDPDGIRQATGDASRSLGPEGQKKGVSTTLPLALGKLQATGDIRRISTNGRLDQQRYKYTLWNPNPLKGFNMDQDEVYVELARRYFRWIGPASLAEFQWFSGLGVKAAKVAIEPLQLSTLDDRLIFPEDLDAFHKHKPAKTANYRLVSGLDAIILLRRDHKSLCSPEDLNREIYLEKGFGSVGGISDLPSHAILDRGRLVGLWEFDTETQTIAWMSFIKKNRDLEAAVAKAEVFVRDQLGDARTFSLDSPKSRAPRVQGIRKLSV